MESERGGAVRRSDVAFAGATRLVSTGISAVWVFTAARFLSVDDFATFALCAALAVIFVALADLGVPTLMASAMVEEPAAGRRILLAALRIRFLAALVVVPAFLVAYSLSSDASIWPAVVMCVSVVATMTHNVCGMALRVVGRARSEATWDLVTRLLAVALGCVLLARGGGVITAVAMYALADMVMLIAVGRGAARNLPSGAQAPPVFRRRGFVLVAITFSLAIVYYRADLWLLGVLREPREVAMYAAAYKIFDAVIMPSLTIAGFVAPKIGRARDASARRTARRLVAAALAITAPAAVAVAIVAPLILDVGFGGDYRAAGTTLRVLMLAALPSAVVFVLGQAIAVIDPARFAGFIVLCLVTNIALNVALIPSHGYASAAWTTLACQMLLAGGWWWTLARSETKTTTQRVATRLPYQSAPSRLASRSASTSDTSRALPAPSSST